VELEIPERDIETVQVGQTGMFVSHARPDEPRPLHVSRVIPSARIREGRNVYLVEANIEAGAEYLKPGMDGVAKVNLGRRPVWWVALHRPIDYLRLKLWL
jgi:multidrug efflux pump subunit AcrA (membrane-fusion protein)